MEPVQSSGSVDGEPVFFQCTADRYSQNMCKGNGNHSIEGGGRQLGNNSQGGGLQPQNPALMEKYLELVDRLACQVPLWHMTCNLDPRAATVAWEAMSPNAI